MPESCPNCKMLRKLVMDLNNQLMAFHQAGHALAQQKIELARAEVEGKRADADRVKAEAEYYRHLQEGTPANPEAKGPARFGSKGHRRIVADSVS